MTHDTRYRTPAIRRVSRSLTRVGSYERPKRVRDGRRFFHAQCHHVCDEGRRLDDSADFRIFRRRLCRIFETDISFVSGRECDRGWGHLARARRVRIASAPSSRPRPRDCGRDTGESPRRANPRHLGGRGASSASAHFRLLARIRRGQPAVPALSSRGVGAGRGASAFRNARGTLRWPPPTWTR